MPRRQRRTRIPASLESRMVLHSFMCNQFGYQSLRDMLSRLNDLSDQLDETQGSPFVQGILLHLKSNMPATKEDLIRYDENITAHSQALGMTDDAGRSWKPFQYLALLFTERYLDLYFQDREILIDKLNEWKNEKYRPFEMDDYTADDIHTLAFQSATGSGKTLFLHANILQYRHYLREHKRLHKLNKIILVTPDEGLSRQHLRELQSSGIPARLFSDDESTDIFSSDGVVVDIIDLHKLDEKKGVKRVALESFEENNLVMVDEGHLGTGGKVWRKRRKQLARNGFTFEYSATFNQAVSGSGDEITKLRDEYGKQILFDYSYKFFYEDGYGKDYKISNLKQSDDGEANKYYLLACLLGFYQQCRIYEDKSGQWRDFNIAPPLWVFLGKTVTGGKSLGEKATETDVVRIIKFLAWVQHDQKSIIGLIERLISGNTGLVDENGADIFRESFPYIREAEPQAIYDNLCLTVFRDKGQLHISHLTGEDELQLGVGNAGPFGVINVGNASGLYAKLEDALEVAESPLFSLSKNAFTRPLFADVDNHNSPVNIVIGARKFAAGWNSWRVSTMGLMHVGTGEGPQIIQMFGRGVRLKGYGMSLKRHTALEGVSPQDSDLLKLLETLNIFGLKANYMDKFREYLEKEGVRVDRVTITLPTKKQFRGVNNLKIIKKQDQAGEFQYSDRRLGLPEEFEQRDVITLERYKHLQILESDKNQTGEQTAERETHKLERRHLKLMDRRSVYYKVLECKRRFSWHNMTISQKTVNELLESTEWYTLYIPSEKLELLQYSRVREWEDLIADLICEYANRYWRKERNKWEHEHLEVATLDDKNPNYVEKYELSVDVKEIALIEDIEQLVEQVERGEYNEAFESGQVQMSLLTPAFHAYKPLLHISSDSRPFVQAAPVALDDNEARFVNYLKDVADARENLEFLHGKEIYLMRNLSRGKGISFFEDYHFYPDFILWVNDSKRQDILFIDPKGLVHFNSRVASKVKLHTRIKETEEKIQQKNPELSLHSYIWSHTQPKNIGSDQAMSAQDCRERGIFLAQGKTQEIANLLKDALAPSS